MSDETESSPENTPAPKAESAPRARRVSTSRPKKAAKAKPEPVTPAILDEVKEEAAPQPAPDVAVEVESIPFPTTPKREERPESNPQNGKDWPDQDADTAEGSQAQSEPTKRKRRRRKGKGQGNVPQNSADDPVTEEGADASTEMKISDAAPEQRPRHQNPSQPRTKIDPEMLAKMAWKIYLAEVSEEGVALIGDNDARDLSRRCFRLAEIFIEEQGRRR